MIIRTLIIMMLTYFVNVNAQELPPRVESILQQAAAIDGKLTKQMHKDFWNEFKKVSSSQDLESIKQLLSMSLLSTQEYQKEIWLSAKISYENRRVVKTQRLIELETKILVDFEKNLPLAKNSLSYQHTMNIFKKEWKKGLENSARLLESSAKRERVTSLQGQSIQLDMNFINTVLDNVDSSIARLKNLFNENWNEQ